MVRTVREEVYSSHDCLVKATETRLDCVPIRSHCTTHQRVVAFEKFVRCQRFPSYGPIEHHLERTSMGLTLFKPRLVGFVLALFVPRSSKEVPSAAFRGKEEVAEHFECFFFGGAGTSGTFQFVATDNKGW
jgi:hypothetical protein